MRLISYDCEVFAYDWLVTLKDKETGVYTCIWNDNEALKMALSDDCIYVGFNSKHYDQYIIKAIAAGFAPEEIKKVNDFIIAGGQGWQCPLLDGIYFRFSNVDIRDDTQQGLSLKAIEGHLGMSVKESSVPFDIDRPLTPEEKAETEFYCKHDVDTAERLIDIRKDYLKNKINLGRLAGLDEVKAMGMTNAKLTAAMLKATKKPHDDERKYVYPDNLRKEYIPPEVFAFFDRMYDLSISDSELFKGKFNLNIGECPVTLGYGGIHGAIPNFFWEETEDRGIWNEDVGSYYPHLCTINGYTSRLLPLRLRLDWILTHCWVKQSAGRGKLLSRIFNRRCRMTDNVNHPAHYETGNFECIEVMLETQGVEAVLNFCQCNAFKYLYRAKRKNGLEDMKKAVWYLNKYIELKEGHNYDETTVGEMAGSQTE